jgi:Lon protease-like protein
MSDAGEQVRFDSVPLFPLPNVVLFPRAVLPLHIFEERYRAMTADALRGDSLIAMALLKPGWQRDYYSRPAIEPVVCVGRILTHERLPDGKYNLLLQGVARATIVREIRSSDLLYRIAELDRVCETPVMEIDLTDQRHQLIDIFEHRLRHVSGLVKQFRQMLSSPLPTADVADLVAFNLLDDVPLKQSLLAETDVLRRVGRVISALEAMELVKPQISLAVGAENPNLN